MHILSKTPRPSFCSVAAAACPRSLVSPLGSHDLELTRQSRHPRDEKGSKDGSRGDPATGTGQISEPQDGHVMGTKNNNLELP
jgi:hypothetical protein